MRPKKPSRPREAHQRPRKPPLQIQPTTLWEYPSQHYGSEIQGDQRYVGATPSWVIWNVLQRYTKPGDTVVDPFCGSGTTLDVCRDLGRKGIGFDVHPVRDDILEADARKLPLESKSADLVFLDPPWGDHIDYSNAKACIGKLSAYDPAFYQAMEGALRECARVVKPGGVVALFCCDYFEKKQGFAPVGFGLFSILATLLVPLDVITVVRHHSSLTKGNYRKAAEDGNFFLRGFNYLFLAQRPAEAPPRERRRRR